MIDSGLEQGVAGYLLKADKYEATFGEAFIKPMHPGPAPEKTADKAFKYFKPRYDFWNDKNKKYQRPLKLLKFLKMIY